MRLIGIAVLSLLLIGSLIVLGQTGSFDTAWQRLSGGGRQPVDDYQLAAMRNFDVEGSDVFATQVDSDAPLILSGLPSFASTSFRLPIDARPVSGTYSLDYSSRVADGVEGVLRITINGIRRTDLLLVEGLRKEAVDIELMPTELAAGELEIGLSLQGRGEIAECTPEDSIAAVVEIAPGSGLRLKLASPVQTVRDKLALWGGRVPVLWQGNQSETAGLRSIINAARLSSKGYSPHFLDKGLSGDKLSGIASQASPRHDSVIPEAYPLPLATEYSNRGARKFGRRTSWRYRYAAQDMPGKTLPSALDLRMQLGPQAKELKRDLVVTLNDRLLFTRRIPSGAQWFNQSIAIPGNAHREHNALEISLSAVAGENSRCGDIEQSVAELLPETVLIGGGAPAYDTLSVLRDRLLAGETIALSGGDITSADAEAASRLLAVLNPTAMGFKTSGARSYIRIVSGDLSRAAAAQRPSGDSWVVFISQDDGGDIIARPLSEFRSRNVPALALLITVATRPRVEAKPAAKSK